ncbi:hypothetical protein BDR07DRAFT_1290287, partial [Suillus spraguei]
FLLEMLHHDGRGHDSLSDLCRSCRMNVGLYHCKYCFAPDLLCQVCIIYAHAHSPVHHVEEWNSTYFQSITLKDLGLRIQLGHKVGDSCLLPTRAYNNKIGKKPSYLVC